MGNHPDLGSDYQILAEVGRGTTGIVYQARDYRLDRVQAIKMPIVSSPADRSQRRTRFLREAQVLAYLTGPEVSDIPTIHEVGECRELLYIVRDFVSGANLQQLVIEGSIELPDGVRVIGSVARTVDRIHQCGIAHRGLHPLNIMVGDDGTAKLIGFGWLGHLAGSDSLPPNNPGVPADLDFSALKQMLSWLYSMFGEPMAARLHRISCSACAAEIGKFADELVNYAREIQT